MKNIPFLLIFSCLLLLFSCNSNEDVEKACFSFDLRQCNGDPWNSDFTIEITEASLIASCRSYLTDQGITISDLSIDMGFHTIVCEACIVCPLGPRYFVSINPEQTDLLTKQELLNFEEVNCDILKQ